MLDCTDCASKDTPMITRLKTSDLIRVFIKNFLLTIAAFSVPIGIQFGYILDDFEPHLLAMPMVFSILVASIMGWNSILRLRLVRSSQVKSEFISGVSHELRTPLTVINGFSRLLSVADDIPKDKREYANRIYHSGEYLLGIINDLLDMSRIESGKMLVNIDKLVLDKEYQIILPMLQSQADEHGIKIVLQPFSQNLNILADKGRLQQVLINLISNAIKYGNDNVNIEIKTETIEHKVRISVIDQGQGLSKEKISQLFIAFNRVGADQNAIKGTGIGLALSKRLIEMMDGTIGVSCRIGEGCQFWFELPISNSAS